MIAPACKLCGGQSQSEGRLVGLDELSEFSLSLCHDHIIIMIRRMNKIMTVIIIVIIFIWEGS